MLYELYNDVKNGDWVAVLFLFLLTCLLVIFLSIVFYFIDSSFIETNKESAIVVEKHHTPAHMQPQVISTGKSTVVNTILIPDSWSFNVSILGHRFSCPVTSSQYEDFDLGGSVVALLGVGRLSGATHCKGVL